MKKISKAIVSIPLLVVGSLSSTLAAPQEVKLLMIGNSFSNNAMEFLPEIAQAGGKKLVSQVAMIGGGTLAQHAERLEAWEKDPQSKEAESYHGKSLNDFVTAEKWDFVSLQQASAENWDPKSYQPYAGKLVEFVKKQVPQAEIIWHVTWSRHESALRKVKTPHKTYAANHEAIQSVSRETATALGIRHLVQAGQAVFKVYSDGDSGFKMENEPGDQTPFSSLNKDGSHLNAAGCYLVGCVWYEFLFQESVVGNSFIPPRVTPEQVKLLQQKAHEIGSAKP